jgi:peptide/nickel transport system substrate-binding protein
MRKSDLLWLIVALIVVGCSPVASNSTSAPVAPAPRAESHRVVIALKTEPAGIASRGMVMTSETPSSPGFLFNAVLTQVDERGAPQPQLAEALPKLNTGSWEVLPDGRMETTYRLKPNLTWHDGAPLTAEDFVFAWRVYTTPEIAAAQAPPVSLMQEVSASDNRTLLIRWSQTYAEADAVAGGRYGLPPLPRHILEEPFKQASGGFEAFVNHPYWSTQFVGAGPYRVEQWEVGSHIDATAFAGYVLGQPALEKIRLIAIGDPSAAVARILAGEVDLAVENVFGLEQARLLTNQWPEGRVYQVPTNSRYAAAQFKTEYASPAQQDLRVRRALMHAADRAALSEALVGAPAVAHTTTGPGVEYFDAVERAVTKYPFDLRLAQEQLSQAGYSRSGDAYVDASGKSLSVELWAYAGASGDSEVAILSDAWKRAGFEVSGYLIPPARAQDLELVSTHPGLRIDQTPFEGDTPMAKAFSGRIATAANRWSGSNRGGYASPEFDRLLNEFQMALERTKRGEAAVRAFKFLSDDLPLLPLYYSPRPVAVTNSLRGVNQGPRDVAWNQITQWSWSR